MNRRICLAFAGVAVWAGTLAVASRLGAQPPSPPEPVPAPLKCVGVSACLDASGTNILLVRAWEDGSIETRRLGSDNARPSTQWHRVP